ncbi:MAG: HAMP domain-containing sensor histidine kinase [Kiloniellaceae bacterium]
MGKAGNQRPGSLFLDAQHQLRQPLNVISLLIGELQEAAGARDRQAIIEDMRYALQLSSTWLDSLADLEKAELGLLRLQVQDVPLQQVFARLSDDFAEYFDDLGLEFRIVATGLVARDDPILLRRIIGILLENAGKFTRRGKVLLGCRHTAGRLRIEVWDSGLGIAEAEAERLFEPFFRLDNEVRPRDRGLGLGLTYARYLAELAGNELRMTSKPGRGSCFSLSLRRADPAAARGVGPGSTQVKIETAGAGTADAPLDSLPVNPLEGATVVLLAGRSSGELLGRFPAWGAHAKIVTAEELAAALRDAPDLLIADQSAFDACGSWDLLRQSDAQVPVIQIADHLEPGTAGAHPQGIKAHFLERPVKAAKLRSLCHFVLTHR